MFNINSLWLKILSGLGIALAIGLYFAFTHLINVNRELNQTVKLQEVSLKNKDYIIDNRDKILSLRNEEAKIKDEEVAEAESRAEYWRKKDEKADKLAADLRKDIERDNLVYGSLLRPIYITAGAIPDVPSNARDSCPIQDKTRYSAYDTEEVLREYARQCTSALANCNEGIDYYERTIKSHNATINMINDMRK